MKRLASFLLSLCLLFTLAAPAFAAGGSSGLQKTAVYDNRFLDVPNNSWFATSVKSVYEYGLMSGASGTAFNPSGNITYAEALALTCRLASIFYDLPAPVQYGNPWYQGYIDYAVQCGFFSADEPIPYEQPITRVDFVNLLMCGIPEDQLPEINDIRYGSIPDMTLGADYVDACYALYAAGVITESDLGTFQMMGNILGGDGLYTSEYAKSRYMDVYTMYRAGILTGNDAYGTFTPQTTITRAEVAAAVSRIAEPALRQHFSLSQMPAAPLVPMSGLLNRKSIQKKATDAQLTEAYNVAAQIVTPLARLNQKAQLFGIAIALRKITEQNIEYSMAEPHYNDPYGFFIKNIASCAGCTRATGLCLNMLGIPYEHVNEDGYTHQWCRINLNGEYWICDAFGMYCGREPGVRLHPYL